MEMAQEHIYITVRFKKKKKKRIIEGACLSAAHCLESGLASPSKNCKIHYY